MADPTSRRSAWENSLILALATLMAAVALGASSASAGAAACSTGSANFASIGEEQCYTVPPGVSTIEVVAAGASGGPGSSAPPSGLGGHGAVVRGELDVTPGETLYVEVGSNGAVNGAASFNGGGAASADAGSGGGASDVRLVPGEDGVASLESRLLIAGGGGGGGDLGFGEFSILNGGAGGNAGVDPSGEGEAAGGGEDAGPGAHGGSGGGAATETRGGAPGAGGVGEEHTGSSGPEGIFGGAQGLADGGGGGGGYYGGGGGGEGGAGVSAEIGAPPIIGGEGGGGGGSSFAARFVADVAIATDTAGKPHVQITPFEPVAELGPSLGLSFPGVQAAQTLSAPQTVTLTNAGSGPLVVSGLTFAGTDPDDFLIAGDSCRGALEGGAECNIQVSFAPQGQGTRTALLEVASNAPTATVAVSGIGGAAAQGPAGERGAAGDTGAAGSQGAPGPQGATGATGQVELVTCRAVITGKGKHRRTVKRCSTKLVSSPLKFTGSGVSSKAVLTRGRVVYARGTASVARTGIRLLLQRVRPLVEGTYTLTITRGGVSRRETVTLG